MGIFNVRLRAGGVLASVLLAGSLASGCFSSSDSDNDAGTDPLQRSTAQGDVRGEGAEDGAMLRFLGIPYAAAPVGDLRFAPPEPAPEREAVLEAVAFGADCPQAAGVLGAGSVEEDCLYLNVYTPVDGDGHPVMIWIHGGAFIGGSGGGSYNPVRLVGQGVVVVTINYRLGALGFLAHPALSDEQGGSGSYGLMDQKAALEWVQENIAAFGGDPDRVTIFGESAGGHSVMSLLVSPDTDGLFHRAIVQSGSYSPAQRSLEAAEAIGAGFGDCDDVACLRGLDVADVLAAQSDIEVGTGVIPNINPAILPHSIAQGLATGDFNQVPVLTGTNLDEYTLFIAIDALQGATPPEPEDYEAEIAAFLGVAEDDELVSLVSAAYPLGAFGDNVWQAMSAIGTDVVFACSALQQAGALAGLVSTYAYEFADRDAPLSLLPISPPGLDLGASHAFEIPYLLDSAEEFEGRAGVTEDQVALSGQMIRYWTQFAREGNPNDPDGADPHWPAFSTNSTPRMMELTTPAAGELTAEDFAVTHRCAIWNAEP